MKLHQHFSINFSLIFFISIFFTAFISYYTLKEMSIKQYEKSLATQMELLKIQLPHVQNLQEFAGQIKEKTENRFTLIDDDGVVLAESDHDPQTMENHSDRKEIKKARADAIGYSLRHSATLDVDFLYMAAQFELHQKPVFLRLSTKLESINKQFFKMWLRIFSILAISISLGLFIIYKLNNKIRLEIEKVTNTLDEISNKNYKAVVNATFSDEFRQIEAHTKKLSTRLEKREKQKRKYTAKIRLISKQRSDIISAISHEFKNPIASIIGYAQTLLDDPNTNEKIRQRFLEKIVKNSNKISYMIDRLSLATKFENGDFTPILTRFNLFELAGDILNNFQDKYKERTFELLGEEFYVKADKTMIEMVIINLLDNAIKYSEGKIILEIKDSSLHVKDSGIGIAPDEIEKVTNKFYRSNTLSWDNSIGLGLALVKHILNLHNSNLEIKSELGVGSDFSFKLA
jgi:signal transduction histidine kinase